MLHGQIFSQHVINKDLTYQVSASWMNDEEQNKTKLDDLGREMKDLKNLVQEHTISALNTVAKQIDVNQKGRQNATRFCSYCRSNGHTPNWCRKKMRDEEVKRVQNEMSAEKKVTFTHDYNKRRGPSHGSDTTYFPTDEDRRHLNYAKQLSREGAMRCAPSYTPNAFRNDRSRQPDRRPQQTFSGYGSNRPRTISKIKATDTTGRITGTTHVLLLDRDDKTRALASTDDLLHLNSKVQFSNDLKLILTSLRMKQKFPSHNDQQNSNRVQFTSMEDSINHLTDLCPLNC